jgi:Na+:H+ antiporter, NhaA family
MIVPATLYLLLQTDQAAVGGWGTVMATDTAFVIGCLALLGARIPLALRVFMLSLAIVDDIGAILVVAIGYSDKILWWPIAAAAVGVAIVPALGRVGVRSVMVYFVLGALIWLAIDAAGVHATIAGVILGLLAPARRWISDERLYAILDRVVAHPDAAGHSGATKDRETLLSWRVIAGGSVLAGIGFTMSLFIAGRAFDPGLIDSAKLGIFAASIVSAALGLAVLAWAARADAPPRA